MFAYLSGMRHIPNLFTLFNLLCGLLAVYAAILGELTYAPFLILLGAIFDFFDGMAARVLKASSPLGAQLDSFADLITFGAAPGFLMMQLLILSGNTSTCEAKCSVEQLFTEDPLPLIGLTFPLLAALRLAKFNTTTTASRDFIGLPSPSAGLFIACWAAALAEPPSNNMLWFHELLLKKETLIAASVVVPLLMLSPLPMPSLKVRQGDKDNLPRVLSWAIIFVLTIVGLIVDKIFSTLLFAVPLYILLSVIVRIIRKDEVQSRS